MATAAWATAAPAATTVERGDVLNVEVLEATDFSRKAAVDADGRINLPVVGGIDVAGLDLDAVRGRIETTLIERGLLNAPKVLVELAAYRPVYVGGDVAVPSALDFRPGLTVRQVIVSAGGLRKQRGDAEVTLSDLLDMLADSQSSAFALLQVKARIARIEAELARKTELALDPDSGTEVGQADRTRILQLEADLMRDRLARQAASSDHKEALLKLLDVELELLQKQSALQSAEMEVQTEEVANARKMAERGLMPRPQLHQLMLEKSQLNQDILENEAFAARARQSQETTRFDLSHEMATARIALLGELQEAQRARAEIEARLRVLRTRLVANGIALSESTQLADLVPSVTIHRVRGGVDQPIEAALDAPVDPGDVLQVTLSARTDGE